MADDHPDLWFEETTGGFEVHYSERLAAEHHELVDESADWLEDQLGVFNLGQVDDKVLLADGHLTETIKDGLIEWWTSRVADVALPR